MQAFLNEYEVVKGSDFTHTSLSDYKSYYIGGSKLDEFFDLYTSYKSPSSITEKHREIAPILIDFDFRQNTIERLYTKNQIIDISRVLMETVSDYIEVEEDTEIFILEKPPRKVKEVYKDGIHIIIPDIVTRPEYQFEFRRLIMPQIRDILEDCKFTNNIEDIYDEAVIQRNNWFLYGSKKPDEPHPWKLSYILKWSKHEIVETDNVYSYDLLVPMLSIRNKYEENPIKRVVERIKKNPTIDNSSLQSSKYSKIASTYGKHELETVSQLVKILNPERANNYDTWIKVGWCLHNIDQSLLPVWKVFSQSSPKYKEYECDKLWNDMRNNGLSIGTLYYWAKQDNLEKFKEIIKNNLYNYVEIAVSGTHTDIARIIYEIYHGDYVCASFKNNLWYEFANHKWIYIENACTLRQKISTVIFKEFVNRASYYQQKAANSEDEDEQKKFLKKVNDFNKVAMKLKVASFKDMLIKECGEMFYDSEFLNKIDTNPKLLGFQNGVYDLNLHEFRNGRSDDYLTLTTGYDFIEDDDENIQIYLTDYVKGIMLNSEMALYLFKIAAYMLDGEKYLEQLWFFTGNGRNSKGVFTSLLNKTFGEYYYEPDISIVTTTKKSSSNANPEIAKAKGKRLLVCAEPDDSDKDNKFRVARLKQLRGNDMIQARALYKDCEEFKPQFGMIFQMNDKPELSKVDDAIAKSLKIINFPYQFVHEPIMEYQRKIDTTLKNKFENDVKYQQQMMLLLIKTHKQFISGNQEIKDPPEVIQETEQYLEENNPVALWLNKQYELTKWNGDKQKIDDVYNNYCNYYPKNSPLNKKKFGELMAIIGFRSKVSHSIRYYEGLKIKTVNEIEDELEI
jgi:P4 family phage/plasmid primase-like protien